MFDMTQLKNSLAALPDRVQKAVVGYGGTVAADMERKAKENRPWNDRTGQARQRLSGRCATIPTGVRISLSHGVNYGIYLEFAHEKRFAIIYPTLRKNAPEAMSGLRGLFQK